MNPKTDPWFQANLPTLIKHMKLPLRITDHDVEQKVVDIIKDHPILHMKRQRINLGRFQQAARHLKEDLPLQCLKGLLLTFGCYDMGYDVGPKAKKQKTATPAASVPSSSSSSSTTPAGAPALVVPKEFPMDAKPTLKQTGLNIDDVSAEAVNMIDKARMWFCEEAMYNKGSIISNCMGSMVQWQSAQSAKLRTCESTIE